MIEQNVSLKPYNTLGLSVMADTLAHIDSLESLQQYWQAAHHKTAYIHVLGGGSNVVLTGRITRPLLKIEIMGIKQVGVCPTHVFVEAGAGVLWHDLVTWTLAQNLPGLENLALIPGTVGAAPIQNIGAYGLELQDFLHTVTYFDWKTGQMVTLDAAACCFGYRDSIFKHELSVNGRMGLKGRAIITSICLALPKKWKPTLGYRDIEHRMQTEEIFHPDAHQIFHWICSIRTHKLPDPKVLGNVGSFFKNPVVTPQELHRILLLDPHVIYYLLDNGQIKLAAAHLIEACGWKNNKHIGSASVYDKQALVLVNHGNATGAEIMALASAIQTSVQERFGVTLHIEPDVI